MRRSARQTIVVGLLALFAVMAVSRAAAQVPWQEPSSQADTQPSQYPANDLSHWPPTETASPLNRTPLATTSQQGASGVVRADYQTPVEPAVAPSTNLPRPNDPPRVLPVGVEAPAAYLQRTHLPPRKTASPTIVGESKGLGTLWTTGGALALVLGLFCVVAWVMRRAAPKAALALPADVVDVLGRAPLGNRQVMHLIRCGGKLLLVNVTPDGAKTLTEITDPGEVDRLTALCEQTRPGGAATAFRQVLDQFSHARRRAVPRDETADAYFALDRYPTREGRDG
ncbi:MAG TPA: flagellar biosynthetic protein FliO [Thermoguttaceae bacterium]|nr:flagellar biosynthetic protein FliO [Thermoguttaceae bacterium]